MTSREFLKWKSWTEKSWSGNHVTTIIQNFTLVSLTSSVTPHPAGLPFGATIPSLLRTRLFTHLSPYALISLCTRLPTHASPYTQVLLLHPCTSQKNILLRYLSEIVHLSRHHLRLLQYATKKLSCWLDAIDAPLLCGSQPRHQPTRVTGWIRSSHL